MSMCISRRLVKVLYRSFWENLVKIWLTSSKRCLHDLAQVLVRRSGENPNNLWEIPRKEVLHDPVQVLVEILVRSVIASKSFRCHVLDVLVWKLFWNAFGSFLYQDLVRSSPAAACPFVTILRNFRYRGPGPGMKILGKLFYILLMDLVGILVTAWYCADSLWEALEGVLLKSSIGVSSHDLVQVLLRRSCGDPEEILLRNSLHSDLEDALRWCLHASSCGIS